MNDKVVIGSVLIALLVLSAAGGYLSGYQVGESNAVAEGNRKAIELRKELDRQAVIIREKEAVIASELAQRLKTEQERIHAIDTTAHQSERIKKLQAELDKLSDERLIVVDPAAVERVWEAVRDSGHATEVSPSDISVSGSTPTYRFSDYRQRDAFHSGWRRSVATDETCGWCFQRMSRAAQYAALRL